MVLNPDVKQTLQVHFSFARPLAPLVVAHPPCRAGLETDTASPSIP